MRMKTGGVGLGGRYPGEQSSRGLPVQRPDVGTAASATNPYKGEFYKERFHITGYHLVPGDIISSQIPFMTKYVELTPNEIENRSLE